MGCFFLRAFTGGWTLGWPEVGAANSSAGSQSCSPESGCDGERSSISLPGVPGVNKWEKEMLRRCMPLSQNFKLLHNRQHCEAPPGRKLLVVALCVPPCCESLWTQVQRNWHQGKSIEIITLKNQRKEEGGRVGFLPWKEQFTLKAICKSWNQACRDLPLSKASSSEGGESVLWGLSTVHMVSHSLSHWLVCCQFAKPTHQGNEKVFKSYACNYKEQQFVVPQEK